MTLMKDLSLFGAEPQELNPYEKYFLLENPFPGHGETSSDVCTDQDELKKEFVYSLKNFSTDAKRLRINGESGAGKTNILRYFEKLTNEARRNKRIENIHPIYVFAPGESYSDIHGQIIDKLSELFLGDLFEQLKSNPKKIDTLSEDIRPASELLAVIKTLVEPNSLFTIYSERERHKDALIRWLKGQKLSAADKKLLTRIGEKPISDITSLSLAIRFLSGLLDVLKELGLCDGIVLLFDEFEEIFEGLSRPRQSRYAQDLRHLFDTLKESVFFVTATTPNPRDLAQYPAIERRLGNAAALQPINSLELAVEYVSDYLDDGRDKYERYLKEREAFQNRAMIRAAWKEHKYEHHPKEREEHENQPQQDRPQHLEPLKQQIIEEEYGLLKEKVEKAKLNVLPGYFLPRMKERIKRKVELPDEQK